MEYIFETRNLKIRRFEIQDAQKLYEKKLKNGYLTKVMQTFKRHGKQ